MPSKPATTADLRPPSPGEGARGGGRGGQGVRALAALLLLAAAPAAAWDVNGNATFQEFSAFNRRFASDAYLYPRHSAAPLGLLGFDVSAGVSADRDFGDTAAGDAVDGNLASSALAFARVGARKGLPGGFDLGVAYGQAVGGGPKLASAELQWAILHGGVLSPALAVRLTGTTTTGSSNYDLRQYGAEVLLSKGFTVLTPYVGAGIVRSRGRLSRRLGGTFEETDTRGVAYAGLTLNLLLPKISFEVEKGETVQGAVRVAIGL